MVVDEVEMKSRRSLPQSVAAGEVLLAECVLVKWVWGRWPVKNAWKEGEEAWGLRGWVANLEFLASGLCTVQWRSPRVGLHSSNWVGGEGLFSIRPGSSLLRRPNHPNWPGSSVAALVVVVSCDVVAVE